MNNTLGRSREGVLMALLVGNNVVGYAAYNPPSGDQEKVE